MFAALSLVGLFFQTPEDPPSQMKDPAPVATVNFVDTLLGKGEKSVAEGDIVTVQYEGTLQATGSLFDSSEKKPPFAFKVGSDEAIPGWSAGLIGMKMGGKRTLCIPPSLAYGDKAAGAIPANSTLIFQTEMLRIEKPDEKQKIEVVQIAPGSGKAAAAGDVVDVHYVGTFLNGLKFDSSRDRNEPISFELGAERVIKGFDEGILGMKIGGKRKITIPYTLAYGEAGRPPAIPRYSTLVFEVELVKFR